jgi:hypothetical protein
MADEQSIKNQLKITNVIYITLAIGLILFFMIVMYLMENQSITTVQKLDSFFTIVIPLFGLLMMYLSRFLFNKMIAKLSVDADLSQKIVQYRTAKIISWALIEGASFLALVAALLTLNYLYIAVLIFLFGYFLLSRPSKESFIKDLHLTSEQSDKIFKS